MLKDDIEKAINETPVEQRGYGLQHARAHTEVSLLDLLADLTPFIKAEIRKAVEAEREACAQVAVKRRDYWNEVAKAQRGNEKIADPAETVEQCRARAQGSGDVADLIRARGAR